MEENKCEVCNGESPDSKVVGVASIPGFPMSVAWCRNCLLADATPRFVADFNLDDYPLQDLADWFKMQTVWYEGQYRTMEAYATMRPHIKSNLGNKASPEQVT